MELIVSDIINLINKNNKTHTNKIKSGTTRTIKNKKDLQLGPKETVCHDINQSFFAVIQ